MGIDRLGQDQARTGRGTQVGRGGRSREKGDRLLNQPAGGPKSHRGESRLPSMGSEGFAAKATRLNGDVSDASRGGDDGAERKEDAGWGWAAGDRNAQLTNHSRSCSSDLVPWVTQRMALCAPRAWVYRGDTL